MAARALKSLMNGLIKDFTVSATIRKGMTVMVSAVATGGEISTIAETGDANDIAIGVALDAGDTTTNTKIRVLLFGTDIVPVLVGTGGATAGKRAGWVADGLTDINFQVAAGATWTPACCYGIFMQTGVAADVVGLLTSGGPAWLRST
jgi:hypothetical protein